MRRGFTLLEITVVVAIISIVAALGLAGISRHTDKTRVQQGARDLAQRIAEARSIAEVAAFRIGTPALVDGPGCPATATPSVSILLDPAANAYIVPTEIRYDATSDQMTVLCATYDVGSGMVLSETHGLGTLFTPTGAQVLISFSPTGRVLRPPTTPNNPPDWYFEVGRNGNPTEKYGYRVLPSGIVCRSSYSATVRCNEDP